MPGRIPLDLVDWRSPTSEDSGTLLNVRNRSDKELSFAFGCLGRTSVCEAEDR